LRRAKLLDAARAKGGGGWAVAADVHSDAGAHKLGGGWAVAADVHSDAGAHKLGTGLVIEGAGGEVIERRQVRIDGQTMSGTAALADHLHVGWLTPQMDRLFQEGAAGRRRFLDRLTFGFDPAHARRMTTFEKVMRERNRLLKEGRMDPHWLTSR